MADAIPMLGEVEHTGRKFKEGFAFCGPKLAAYRKEEIINPNLSIPRAVARVLGALPELLAQRAAILEELPRFKVAHLDEIEVRARALGYAHALFQAANTPQEAIPGLVEAVRTALTLLEADLVAAATRRLINAPQLFEPKSAETHEELGFRLLKLAQIAEENLARLAGKSGITPAEIEAAEELADRLITALGRKAEAPKLIAEAADTRARAFTHFYRAYDEIRRALTYLRWHEGDLEQILPQLYPGRSPAERPHAGEPRADGVEQPTSGAGAQASSAVPAGAGVSTVSGIPAGLPGAKPFADR